MWAPREQPGISIVNALFSPRNRAPPSARERQPGHPQHPRVVYPQTCSIWTVYVAKPSNRSTCAVCSLRRGPSARRYGGMRHTEEASSNAHHICGAACTRRGVVNLLPIDMSSW
jgi:hypothetical protein